MYCKLVEHVPGQPVRNPQCRICNLRSDRAFGEQLQSVHTHTPIYSLSLFVSLSLSLTYTHTTESCILSANADLSKKKKKKGSKNLFAEGPGYIPLWNHLLPHPECLPCCLSPWRSSGLQNQSGSGGPELRKCCAGRALTNTLSPPLPPPLSTSTTTKNPAPPPHHQKPRTTSPPPHEESSGNWLSYTTQPQA